MSTNTETAITVQVRCPHWPYKAWLAARQDALARRFAPAATGPLFETIGEREAKERTP